MIAPKANTMPAFENMGRERIISLQILRLAAAMMVVGRHVTWLSPAVGGGDPSPVAQKWGAVGASGVDLFFVLSGFVIALTGPQAVPRPSGLEFFWRRWRRVAPVYYLLSLPILVVAWRAGAPTISQVTATFLFWPISGDRMAVPYISQGWTLSYEMAFYSAISLLLAVGRRRMILVALALLTARLFSSDAALRFLTSPMMLEFGAGVALAGARRRLASLAPQWGFALICTGVALLSLATLGDPIRIASANATLGPDALTRLLVFGTPAVFIVTGAIVCERHFDGRLAHWLARGGDASYAIYLTHAMTIAAVVVFTRAMRAGPTFAFPVAFGATVCVGLATYRFVERPILSDLKRL